MKRFIITGTFPGEVYAIYGAEQTLLSLDFRAAELRAEQIDWIKARIPTVAEQEQFNAFLAVGKMMLTVEGAEVTFEEFWTRYGRKVNKKRCEAIWSRLSGAKRAKAYFGIMAYFAFLDRVKWRSKADPETYLKEEYWETDWKTVTA